MNVAMFAGNMSIIVIDDGDDVSNGGGDNSSSGSSSSSNATAAAGAVAGERELPPDMVFGEAQVISISVYSVLFVVSGVLNLNVLANLLRARRHVGLSRLNHLLLQLVLADLLVRRRRPEGGRRRQ